MKQKTSEVMWAFRTLTCLILIGIGVRSTAEMESHSMRETPSSSNGVSSSEPEDSWEGLLASMISAATKKGSEADVRRRVIQKRLAELPAPDLKHLVQRLGGSTPSPPKDWVDLAIEAKQKTEKELKAILGDKTLAETIEAESSFQELLQRYLKKPKHYLGFITSPEMVRRLEKNLVVPFLKSPEGKKFIKENEALLLGQSGPSPSSNQEKTQTALGKALKDWDEKNGNILSGLGLRGPDAEKALMAVRKELGSKTLVVGIFVPGPPMDRLLEAVIQVASDSYIPKIRAYAAEEGANAVEEAKKMYQRSHPILGGLPAVSRAARRARSKAKKGAAQGAEDGIRGIYKPRSGDSIYRTAYQQAHQKARSLVSKAHRNLESAVLGGLEKSLSPGLEAYGVELHALKAAPPGQGNFPQDSVDKGFAAKPYFSLYDLSVNSQGVSQRDTYFGWYAHRIDEKSANLNGAYTNGEIYEWLNEFATSPP